VAALRPNRHGLFDLHGNLWEWTMSLYDLEKANDEFQKNRNASTTVSDGNGPWVLRGGSFNNGPAGCRAGFRVYRDPSYSDDVDGFRAARACSP
jgi:formylglycine-generating enzyme required for sulfatase activity